MANTKITAKTGCNKVKGNSNSKSAPIMPRKEQHLHIKYQANANIKLTDKIEEKKKEEEENIYYK